jgi:hypothetical protein
MILFKNVSLLSKQINVKKIILENQWYYLVKSIQKKACLLYINKPFSKIKLNYTLYFFITFTVLDPL